jgi:hypothetical protein
MTNTFSEPFEGFLKRTATISRRSQGGRRKGRGTGGSFGVLMPVNDYAVGKELCHLSVYAKDEA